MDRAAPLIRGPARPRRIRRRTHARHDLARIFRRLLSAGLPGRPRDRVAEPRSVRPIRRLLGPLHRRPAAFANRRLHDGHVLHALARAARPQENRPHRPQHDPQALYPPASRFGPHRPRHRRGPLSQSPRTVARRALPGKTGGQEKRRRRQFFTRGNRGHFAPLRRGHRAGLSRGKRTRRLVAKPVSMRLQHRLADRKYHNRRMDGRAHGSRRPGLDPRQSERREHAKIHANGFAMRLSKPCDP